MLTYRLRPMLWLFMLLALSAPIFAQFDTATVLGTVKDSSGAVIQGARVTLENKQTNVAATRTTDENGNYEFPNVRIGQYQVRAEMSGFQTAVAEAFTVQVNARQRVDLALNVGSAAESVVVSGAATLLETESSDRGTVINQQAIVNLPLNGRAYADLALLSPGVRRSVLSNQTVTSRDSSFNVNGLRSSLNNFELDGVDNNAYGTSNQGFSNQVVQVNPDAVQEFRVQTNNYSAEYGRAGGAIINASMRSGTNRFHASAWEFLRNTELNAVGYFKPLGGVKPTFIQNQFGGAAGGPIVKNKMFVFGDYEGLRRVTRVLNYSTVPTLDQRNGIFGTPITNPYTGEVYSNGVVPQSQITQFARTVFGDLPAPNRPSASATSASNNFESLPRGTLNDDKGDIRYDQYFGQKATAFVRYSHRLANIFDPPAIPGDSGGNSNGYLRILNQQIAPGMNYTINSSSVVEFRIGISLTEGGKTPIGLGLPTAKYGITGLPTDPRYTGGLNSQSISGFTQLGRQTSNPQFQNPWVINPKVNYSKILSRHSLKFGFEYQRIDTAINDFHPKYGQDTYSGQFSRPAGTGSSSNATLSQAYNLADFLFGARSNYQINNDAILDYRQRMYFMYVQDDFKISTKLTLNVGLRYEYATPQWEEQNRLASFDPATNTLIQAKNGSVEDRALVKPDRNNFAPRIGLAYQVTPRTAIRSGYGISYIHFNRMGGENLLGYNGPNIVNASVNQSPLTQPVCSGNAAPTTCFRPTPQGYPEGLVVPANFNPLTARVNYIPRDNPTGYVQSWHLTVQRELAKDLVVDVAYVGNRGVDLMILGDYNQAVPQIAGQNLLLQARRPIPNFSWIQVAFGGGFSTYHALQFKVEKRYSAGLYLLNSFTWSKALDNAAGHLEANSGDNSRINFRNLPSEKGISNYDQPFNNTTSMVYEIPFGKGRKFGNGMNRAFDTVVGGWRMTAINTATSGIPINITYSIPSQYSVSDAPSYRPNYVGGSLVTPEGQRTILNYLNPAAVALPTATGQFVNGQPLVPFGTLGRNTARSHSFEQLDLGLHKDFPLWSEESRLQFRAEAFNLLNTTNFQPANSTAGGSTYGQITTTFPARQIQFGLKLLF